MDVREQANNLYAGLYLKMNYERGDPVIAGDSIVRIHEIGPVTTTVNAKEKIVSVPNKTLMKSIKE